MEKKKYYAITASVTFEKTVLVPVDSVEDIDEAIDLVDCGVEVASIMLLEEDAYFETSPASFSDRNGICEFTDEQIGDLQIIRGNK